MSELTLKYFKAVFRQSLSEIYYTKNSHNVFSNALKAFCLLRVFFRMLFETF